MTKVQKDKFISSTQSDRLSRRRFFYFSGAAIFTTGLLTSCNGLLEDIIPKKTKPETTPPVEETKGDRTLAFFGDSLTVGAGGITPYGNLVGEALPGRPAVNDGIGGQIALSISIRQGGTPVTVSVEGGKLDGTREVKVTKMSNAFLSTPINNNTYSRTGSIGDVKCKITRTAAENQGDTYTISAESGVMAEIPAESVFVLDDAVRFKTATQILWYGRNNIGTATAEADILSALESSIKFISEPKRYIVVGVLLAAPEIKGTVNYNQVVSINEKLSSVYGNTFVEMTPPTSAEMESINYTPTPQDLADLENGNFPTGMRADDIHVNDKGYQIVANRVVKKLKELKL